MRFLIFYGESEVVITAPYTGTKRELLEIKTQMFIEFFVMQKKSRPCVRKDFVYSLQLHNKKAILSEINRFRGWLLHSYGSWEIPIIVPHTGTKWELLEELLEEGAID